MGTQSGLSLKLAAVLLWSGLAGCAYSPTPSTAHVYSEPAVIYHDYYYPSVQVYWHIGTGEYWYYRDTHWVHSRYLPAHIHLHRHTRLKLRAPAHRPYLKHHEHVRHHHGRQEYHHIKQEMRPSPHDVHQESHDSVIKAPAARQKHAHPHEPHPRHDRGHTTRPPGHGAKSAREHQTARDEPHAAPAAKPAQRQPGTIKGNLVH